MAPTSVNGRPAAVAYLRGAAGVRRPDGTVVLATTATHVARIVVFADPGLVGVFGLPERRASGSAR
ncbi:hypothetical protein BJF78_25220 [Pseudonocardia sp. CNS-139]|nr:hypothetical protein BJF78_25220 [Pseudonocardia sp. CNS-139]